MTACLRAGLYGIENKLELRPPTVGSGYADKDAAGLANNLQKATGLMRDSEIAKEIFGENFVDHFCTTREWEWKKFSEEVTDWEKKRYFEII
jgi:glutamine synthetase